MENNNFLQKPTNIYAENSNEAKYDNSSANSAIEGNDYIDQFVYDNLPKLLKESCNIFNDRYEKDVFLLGALSVLGGCFHRLFAYNNVDKKKVAANLLAFIVAPPASGKGVLNYSRKLADGIKNTFAANSKTLGSKGTNKLFTPANSSASGLIQLLKQNEGVGIMVESEIDTLINANKQDWGHYSDILRNAFDNEKASLYRKTEKEYIELENLKMSLAISGTPGQFKTLMFSVENGLFSRGCYYVFDNSNSPLTCFGRTNNVTGKDLDEQFADFANIANDYYNQHLQHDKVQVVFNEQQLSEIQDSLKNELARIVSITELRANINRSFTIALKIATLLTFLKECETGSLTDKVICSDIALKTAINLMQANLKHSYKAYELLPTRNRTLLKVNEQRLFSELPSEFTRAQAVQIGGKIGIGERTIDSCLKTFKDKGLVDVTGKGKYKKKE